MVGLLVGLFVGCFVGCFVGRFVGCLVGAKVGFGSISTMRVWPFVQSETPVVASTILFVKNSSSRAPIPIPVKG